MIVSLIGLFWLILFIAALVSCIQSSKPSNTKLLWILIIVIVPGLGSLLWFLWGKQAT